MYKDKKIMALIPARGGSKGLPGKNIRPLLGKPLIAWSIEQALSSRYLDRVIVSTDYEDISEIAKKYGAEVPFLRPAELAADSSGSIDVIAHAVAFLGAQNAVFDYLVLLEPTSPLREAADIEKSVELLIDNSAAKAIVGVARLEGAHPEFNIIIDSATGCIRNAAGGADFRVLRRQELQDVYFLEGTIYMSEIPTLLSRRTFYHELTLPYVVPRWKSLEIDELHDFISAEALLKARIEGLF